MGHNAPRFEWRARPYRRTSSVFFELVVNRRPVAAVYWTSRAGGRPFYVGQVYGGPTVGPLTARESALKATEEAYRNHRWPALR